MASLVEFSRPNYLKKILITENVQNIYKSVVILKYCGIVNHIKSYLENNR